jgi:gas vesicle protein
MKDKYAMAYDGKEWNLTIKEDIINKIYDDEKNYIEENLDDFVKSLSSSRKNALDRWLETNDEDEKITKIKNEIKLLLYNKRNLVEPKKNKITKAIIDI